MDLIRPSLDMSVGRWKAVLITFVLFSVTMMGLEVTAALAAKARLLKRQPGYKIARLRSFRPCDNAVFWQQAETHILAGLRRAGIPEQ